MGCATSRRHAAGRVRPAGRRWHRARTGCCGAQSGPGTRSRAGSAAVGPRTRAGPPLRCRQVEGVDGQLQHRHGRSERPRDVVAGDGPHQRVDVVTTLQPGEHSGLCVSVQQIRLSGRRLAHERSVQSWPRLARGRRDPARNSARQHRPTASGCAQPTPAAPTRRLIADGPCTPRVWEPQRSRRRPPDAALIAAAPPRARARASA
jgi:hypothetical protein